MAASIMEKTVGQVKTLTENGPLHAPEINVGQIERWASLIGGGALAAYGLSRPSLGGLVMALVGGSLVYRGVSGHCYCYDLLDINTANQARGEQTSIPAGEGMRVERTITVNRPVNEVYRFWRDFTNLPRVMRHLESVTPTGMNRTHWVAKGPMGIRAEWDAEIITETENELLGWRSLPGSTVATAGSVHFHRLPGDRGTEIQVRLKYEPPAGKLGAMFAKLFGRAPEQEITEDLERFKKMMESGQMKGTSRHREFARA